MFVVVSYDISEDKRRTKIHKILKPYGQWMQFSLFECDLSEKDYAKLRSRLNKIIDHSELRDNSIQEKLKEKKEFHGLEESKIGLNMQAQCEENKL